jgi:signal transduction histidine kinase
VQIVLRFDTDTLAIEVADDGDATGPGGGTGKGLPGVRERVAVLGGQLVAAPGPRGFVLRALLPLG